MPNDSAESKARQRARNSGGTRAGSSGAGGLIARMEKRSYADIAEVAQKGPAFAGQVTDVRMLANRTYSVSILVPAAYAHELVDLGHDSAAMFTFFRSSHVPRGAMLPKVDDEDEGDDDADDS